MTDAAASCNRQASNLVRNLVLLVFAIGCWLAFGTRILAATPVAGLVITNQASATFRDWHGVTQSGTSNLVQVVIGQVASFTLAANSAKTASPGSTVYFPHTLVNTGNGTDRFSLSALQLPGTFAFTAVQFFIDADGDGQPDNNVAISTTGNLLPQGVFRFVVAAVVPPAAVSNTSAQIRIDSTSTIDPSRTSVGAAATVAALMDTATLGTAPALTLQKTVSNATPNAGESITYRLTVRNSGGSPAVLGHDVMIDGVASAPILLRDAIPANTGFTGIVTPVAAGITALYHRMGDAEQTYTTAPPADLANVDAVAFALPSLAVSASAEVAFRVTLHANAAMNGSGAISNTGYAYFKTGSAVPVSIVASNAAAVALTSVAAQIRNYTGPDYNQTTDYVRLGNQLYLRADASACNVSATVIEQRIVVITGPNGETENFDATETGPNTGVFVIAPIPSRDSTVVANDGILEVKSGDQIGIEMIGCGIKITAVMALIDPAGTVFNSRTNAPLAGALVNLVKGNGAGGCTTTLATVRRLVNGVIQPAPSSVTTGADGKYEFELTDIGDYCLAVTPPALFTFPSIVAAGLLPAGRTIAATGPTAGGSYGNNFKVTLQTGPVKIDVPLDPLAITSLFIQKTASRQIVELADFLDYTIKVRNNDTVTLGSPGVTVTDNLPAGFAYLPGSARLNGAPTTNPAGGGGPRLDFNIGALIAAGEATLTYRVRIGPGALQGDGINRARASVTGSVSNEASVKVTVQGGVFSDRGFLVGKVYLDCNRNRVQDKDESGIPGVRVYLEDGTYAISDGEGKYSFYGISPRTHVLKLDKSSMPAGSELIGLSNRNAGDPGSVFIDMKNGELMKADFAEASCTPQIRKEVELRRANALPAAETDRSLQQKMDVDGQLRLPGDPKAQPASGVIGSLAPAGFTPLAPQPAAPLNLAPVAVSAPAKPAKAIAELETLLPALDNKFGFIELKDQDVVPIAQTGVRIKGTAGSLFELSVNGQPVPASRIGKKSVLQDKQLQAWEFIGIALKPGPNELVARQMDTFGNLRGTATITLIAPDSLGKLELVLPSAGIADGRSAAKVIVKVTDSKGVPVTVRTPVTLEASIGRWQADDLDPREPGLQVFIEGGRGEFLLTAPDTPGAAQIRVSSGTLKTEKQLDFLPDLRPMIGAGLVEGVLNLRKLDSRALVPARKQDSFEQELTQFSRTSGDGKTQAAARAALFLKGKVKGDYLLTLAYDSDKETRERLFRDIQPDEFYPVYGDSSVRGFDAQSTSKLYVRVDSNKSYLLYGDFTTQSAVEARKLANYSRSLTGLKEHYETDRVAVNAFASRDSTRQVVDELRANGTSGPYRMSSANPVVNSEKVEILVRDRNQPALVLKTLPQSRFIDYEMEQLSGQIIFKMPLPSLDPNFNPQSIRVTYEVEQGGAQFWVAGVDAQVKVTDRIEVGAVVVRDSNPQDPVMLRGVNATVKLGEKTFVTAEVARNDKASVGTGSAKRIELRHDGVDTQVLAYAGRADTEFDNPGSALARGRAESGLKMTYRIDDKTLLKGETLRTEDLVNGGRRDGAYVSIERSVTDNVRVEVGMRHAKETDTPANPSSAGATPNEFTSARGKVSSQVPGLPQASVYAEYEQDIHNSDRKIAALGGDYQLAGAGRLYLRHEFISSLSGPYALNGAQTQNATVAGIDFDYMKDGHVFSEYRIRDAISGSDTEAALGLRNTWRVADGVGLTTGFERVHTLAGTGAGEAMAVTLGVDYTANPLWKGSARLELRRAESSDNLLNTLGMAAKLSSDWTALARNTLTVTRNRGTLTGSRIQERLQAGLAYRETNGNKWNGLGRIEHRYEKDDTQTGVVLKRSMQILSLHANYQPTQPLTLTGRYAGKWVSDKSNGIDSKYNAHLLGGRIGYDLDEHWNASMIATTLASGDGRSRQYGLGLELGYLVSRNLWLSGGYNFFGFKDDDLSGADYTNRGVFVRLRYKFDEEIFGSAKTAPAAGSTLK